MFHVALSIRMNRITLILLLVINAGNIPYRQYFPFCSTSKLQIFNTRSLSVNIF